MQTKLWQSFSTIWQLCDSLLCKQNLNLNAFIGTRAIGTLKSQILLVSLGSIKISYSVL